jgi:mitogen-activated protein kinase kinase kinase 4
LNYAEQWVLVAVPHDQRKSALDDEWNFTRLVAPMITNQHSLAATKFGSIVESLFDQIGQNLLTRSMELRAEASLLEENVANVEVKWQLCRNTQKLFTQSRDQCFKVMAFAKTLCRDIEKIEFHRDHNDEQLRNPDNFVCASTRKAATSLMECALLMRERLTATIKGVQEKCDNKTIAGLDMDEMDRLSFLSRTREILHQGMFNLIIFF